MTGSLVPLDAVRSALAEIASPAEAKDVRDKAGALRRYAQAAKDRELFRLAAETELRAARRLGQMLAGIKAGDGLSSGGRPPKTGSNMEQVLGAATLEELGIDRKLSMRAQRLWALGEEEFEARLPEALEQAATRAAGGFNLLYKAVARPPSRADTPPLPEGVYRAIYADPPWQFATRGPGGQGRAPENHYSTMSTPEICALQVERLAADDCVLFLWATGPMLRDAFVVLEAWGFAYKTLGFIWAKDGPNGLGYWSRCQGEVCLLATRGSPRRREGATDVGQLIRAPRSRHSEKPADTYDRIERLVEGPYIELFARAARPGWDAWGNEAGGSEAGGSG